MRDIQNDCTDVEINKYLKKIDVTSLNKSDSLLSQGVNEVLTKGTTGPNNLNGIYLVDFFKLAKTYPHLVTSSYRKA